MERNKLKEIIKKTIRDIPNFPKEGILFKDLTPLFKSKEVFKELIDHIYEYYSGFNITKVTGIEARGFISGSAIAYRLDAGFIPIRKKGKLPHDTIEKRYELEYGYDEIEMHKDALNPNDVVLIHDDLLATGGTINAAIEIVRECNVKKVYVNFICELMFLKGREKIDKDIDVYSVVLY